MGQWRAAVLGELAVKHNMMRGRRGGRKNLQISPQWGSLTHSFWGVAGVPDCDLLQPRNQALGKTTTFFIVTGAGTRF